MYKTCILNIYQHKTKNIPTNNVSTSIKMCIYIYAYVYYEDIYIHTVLRNILHQYIYIYIYRFAKSINIYGEYVYIW